MTRWSNVATVNTRAGTEIDPGESLVAPRYLCGTAVRAPRLPRRLPRSAMNLSRKRVEPKQRLRGQGARTIPSHRIVEAVVAPEQLAPDDKGWRAENAKLASFGVAASYASPTSPLTARDSMRVDLPPAFLKTLGEIWVDARLETILNNWCVSRSGTRCQVCPLQPPPRVRF